MRRHLIAALLAVALIAATVAVGVLWNRPPDDLEGEWGVASFEVDGQDAPKFEDVDPGSAAMLRISDEGGRLVASATVGCNHHGSALTYRIGGKLTFGEWRSTLRGCPPEVPSAEDAFVAALGEVDHVEVGAEEMTLTGGDVRLTFARIHERVEVTTNGPD